MSHPLPQPESPTEQSPQPRRGHARRPPLAEVDSWELWQAWRRGERTKVLPWIGLLVSFCMVLAGMYSFFFFSTRVNDDTTAMVVLTFVFLAGLFALWRRISARRGFALIVVALILAVSGFAFVLWLAAYRFSEWNPLVAVVGTLLLGLSGALIGLPVLDSIARQQEEPKGAEPAQDIPL